MNFLDFLINFKDRDFFRNYKILIFRTEVYSVLFFSKFLNLLVNNSLRLDYILQVVDPSNISLTNFKIDTQVSFLSSKSIFWINLFNIDIKIKNEWIDFLNSYSGEHFIVCCMNTESEIINTQSIMIDIPEYINMALYKNIFSFFYPQSPFDSVFVKNIYEVHSSINLDDSITIMQYSILLGRKVDDFISTWLDKIVSKDSSLFTLSQYFFAKQEKVFLLYWLSIKNSYGEEFWLVFWSEQIWQAIVFINIAVKSGVAEAKKYTTRLPFSFIKNDWRLHDVTFLIKVYNSLYDLDYALKNGKLSAGAIDLWYMKFFKSRI